MALVRVAKSAYSDDYAIHDVINYAANPCKSRLSEIVCYNAAFWNIDSVIQQFYNCQYAYGKASGKRIYHFIISFSKNDIYDHNLVIEISKYVCINYFNEYQCIACLHTNTDNLHIHFVFNSVNLINGKKFSEHLSFFYKMQKDINEYIKNYNNCLQ